MEAQKRYNTQNQRESQSFHSLTRLSDSGTCCIDRAVSALRDPSASAYGVLGWKACTTMASPILYMFTFILPQML